MQNRFARLTNQPTSTGAQTDSLELNQSTKAILKSPCFWKAYRKFSVKPVEQAEQQESHQQLAIQFQFACAASCGMSCQGVRVSLLLHSARSLFLVVPCYFTSLPLMTCGRRTHKMLLSTSLLIYVYIYMCIFMWH